MRKPLALVASAALVLGCGQPGATPTAAAPPPATDLALESARTTANIFLKLLEHKDGWSAFSLLSDDFRGRLSNQERRDQYFRQVELIRRAAFACGPGGLSDTKIQAAFNGRVTLVYSETTREETKEFTLVLVRPKESGAWRVDLFSIHN